MTRSRREVNRIRAGIKLALPAIKSNMDNKIDRPDDPHGVMEHVNRFKDKTALIILGGLSSKNYKTLQYDIRPDVILGGNGVNSVVKDLDYWMCAENMNLSNGMAKKGDIRATAFMEMFHRDSGAKIKLISHLSWDLLRDKTNCINIRRMGYEQGKIPSDFSLRSYGEGFMAGWVFADKNAINAPLRVGTVGAQLLHMAGILGVREVHTIGFDLIMPARVGLPDHFYPYPIYQSDRFRRPGMFVKYKGVNTQLLWIETAQFLKSMESTFENYGLKWIDHSQGLLSIMGLKCAQVQG